MAALADDGRELPIVQGDVDPGAFGGVVRAGDAVPVPGASDNRVAARQQRGGAGCVQGAGAGFQPVALSRQRVAQVRIDPVGDLVDALPRRLNADQWREPFQQAPVRVQRPPMIGQPVIQGGYQPVRAGSQLEFERRAVRRHQLGGGGGRGRALVGGEIHQREVDLVPDAGHDRDVRRDHGAHNGLVIEAPQVFQAAAAARQQDHVDLSEGVQPLDGLDDLGRGVFALDGRRAEHDLDHREAPPQHVLNVLKGRGGRRRHDSDPAREGRDRALQLRREEALGLQPGLEQLELAVQLADACRLDRVTIKLVLAARLVDGHAPVGQHRVAVLRLEGQKCRLAPPHDARQLALVVFEREVQVARRGPLEIADLALDPYILQARFKLEQVADGGGKLVNGVRVGHHNILLAGMCHPIVHHPAPGCYAAVSRICATMADRSI